MQIQHSEFHDQLLRGLAHKMNNYLSLFQGYLSLLMDDENLDPETLEGLLEIRDGATAASELLDRTKALARPSSLIWREIDLVKFMDSLKPQLERIESCKNVQVEYSDDLPHVLADPGRLRTAIKEIVKNACESASQDGSVMVRVQGNPDLPEPTMALQSLSWVSIDIRDNGPGIPEELREKILQPFFTTRARSSAMGLGLTLANELMQQMEGQLRFESDAESTTFHLLLSAKTQKY